MLRAPERTGAVVVVVRDLLLLLPGTVTHAGPPGLIDCRGSARACRVRSVDFNRDEMTADGVNGRNVANIRYASTSRRG